MRPSRHICPVCGRIAAPRLNFSEFTVAACPGCHHEFTTDLKPGLGEAYDPQYFRKAHANWFANPDIGLFDELAGVIARHAGKEAAVIDVGCGNGAFLNHLRQNDFSNLTGLDIFPQDLPEPIRYLQTPIEDYSGEETFDAVISLANIEHLADPRDAMIRLARLLAPKGLLAVYTVANESLLYRAAKVLADAGVTFAARRLYDPHHLNHFSVSSLARTAATAGLLPVRTTRRDIPQSAVDLPASPLRPLVGLAVSAISAASKAMGGQMLQLALFTNVAGSGI
jgi:SAM-dependent methyltransferase